MANCLTTGGQRKKYKDQLQVNMKICNIEYRPTKLEALAQWIGPNVNVNVNVNRGFL